MIVYYSYAYQPLIFNIFFATIHSNGAHFQCFFQLMFQMIDRRFLPIQKFTKLFKQKMPIAKKKKMYLLVEMNHNENNQNSGSIYRNFGESLRHSSNSIFVFIFETKCFTNSRLSSHTTI